MSSKSSSLRTERVDPSMHPPRQYQRRCDGLSSLFWFSHVTRGGLTYSTQKSDRYQNWSTVTTRKMDHFPCFDLFDLFLVRTMDKNPDLAERYVDIILRKDHGISDHGDMRKVLWLTSANPLVVAIFSSRGQPTTLHSCQFK